MITMSAIINPQLLELPLSGTNFDAQRCSSHRSSTVYIFIELHPFVIHNLLFCTPLKMLKILSRNLV